MLSAPNEIKIFSGSAHEHFSANVCHSLGFSPVDMKIFRFSDGEIGVSIQESVRGSDAYIIQPTSEPVNENLMELLIITDALKRASASKVNVVIPYFGYARQDRKTRSREPITAKLVANLIEKAGADRVITADLHAGQIQGFFDIPVDHLTGIPLLGAHFKRLLKKELEERRVVVVSPDVGGVVRARRFAEMINADLAIVDKRRSHDIANYSEVMDIIGDIRGRVAIMVDDIIDTAGTLVNAAKAIQEQGAERVYAGAIHGVLSGPAVDRIEKSCIEELVLTDTIPLSEAKQIKKITILSIAPLFAEAIRRIHFDHSVSSLFNPRNRSK